MEPWVIKSGSCETTVKALTVETAFALALAAWPLENCSVFILGRKHDEPDEQMRIGLTEWYLEEAGYKKIAGHTHGFWKKDGKAYASVDDGSARPGREWIEDEIVHTAVAAIRMTSEERCQLFYRTHPEKRRCEHELSTGANCQHQATREGDGKVYCRDHGKGMPLIGQGSKPPETVTPRIEWDGSPARVREGGITTNKLATCDATAEKFAHAPQHEDGLAVKKCRRRGTNERVIQIVLEICERNGQATKREVLAAVAAEDLCMSSSAQVYIWKEMALKNGRIRSIAPGVYVNFWKTEVPAAAEPETPPTEEADDAVKATASLSQVNDPAIRSQDYPRGGTGIEVRYKPSTLRERVIGATVAVIEGRDGMASTEEIWKGIWTKRLCTKGNLQDHLNADLASQAGKLRLVRKGVYGLRSTDAAKVDLGRTPEQWQRELKKARENAHKHYPVD